MKNLFERTITYKYKDGDEYRADEEEVYFDGKYIGSVVFTYDWDELNEEHRIDFENGASFKSPLEEIEDHKSVTSYKKILKHIKDLSCYH